LARGLLEAGVRPKVLVVEYNSSFGPAEAVTVPYRAGLELQAAPASGLYYGASIAAWRRALAERGYRFVAVESSGVNAFFLDPAAFDPGFAGGLRGLEFRENR